MFKNKIRFKYFAHHVEVFDRAGRFLFSADTEDEAYDLLNEME